MCSYGHTLCEYIKSIIPTFYGDVYMYIFVYLKAHITYTCLQVRVDIYIYIYISHMLDIYRAFT